MLVTGKIWFKQIIAAFFVLLLFTVAAIRVSHSHSSGVISSLQKKPSTQQTDFSNGYKPVSDSKCFICEYQLARDADVNHPVSPLQYTALFNDAVPVTYFIVLSAAHSVFENRGPPHAD